MAVVFSFLFWQIGNDFDFGEIFNDVPLFCKTTELKINIAPSNHKLFPPMQHSNKTVYPVLLYNHCGFALMFILAPFSPMPSGKCIHASVLVLALENAGEF